MPANSGPVILPRMVQGAIPTCGSFRMRLYFPESLRVFTYSLSSASPNQTGVGTATPLLRKVERLMYFRPLNFAGDGHHNIVRDKNRPTSGLLKMCRIPVPFCVSENPSPSAAEI